MRLLSVLAVALVVYAPVSVQSLVCYQCNLTTTVNITGEGPCDVTVASAVECAADEVCFAEKEKGRGCRAKPANFTGGAELTGDLIVCDTDVCNHHPLFNLSCYECSQQTRADCVVNSDNIDVERVTLLDCNYGDYCNYGYLLQFGGVVVSAHRRCSPFDSSACRANGCMNVFFGSGDCEACCSSNKCNTETDDIAKPPTCYHCAQTGPNAETNCAINSENMNASRVVEYRCPYNHDVCLSRRETKGGAVASFVRTCFSEERCQDSSACDSGNGVCSTCFEPTEAPTTEAPTTEAPTTEAPTTEAPTAEAPTAEAPTSGSSLLRAWFPALLLLAGGTML